MTQMHRNRIVPGLAALSLGLVIGLAGCAQQQQQAAAPAIVPTHSENTTFRNQVVPMTAQTQVRVRPGPYGGVTADEDAKLAAFLNANNVARSARITLSSRGGATQALAVRDRLVAYGVYPRNITIQPAGQAAWAGTEMVDVSVEQYQVQTPECGTWDPSRHFEETSADWGCSTVRALGLMVADPHDLVAGKDAGHTSGVTQAGAIERYHTDKPTPFVTNSISATQ